jgi:hypothetical protein
MADATPASSTPSAAGPSATKPIEAKKQRVRIQRPPHLVGQSGARAVREEVQRLMGLRWYERQWRFHFAVGEHIEIQYSGLLHEHFLFF